ncbi:Mechanosensitive ion channel inner membrane domain 1 [Vibrio sp. B1FLJ16]|uniref:hypothetical protein n=1 Tax=Vibrio sp. B1FLJ16 TaxID=2751178 RepID=UPI001AF76B17|nr:hypothetical protein [Vibrio sp. B1FLJ16]CAD7806992.1 Mechanosensitive ion channel inner membrane domain 1 [Vibrio sp. B1FLJ16]CAE6904583.1 Mechanosensitive ion channel inner membrane domain 1 [Vibrio sp. B1FLJ16]
MIRKKEIYSYVIVFIAMIVMSITIYLLTTEDDTTYTNVLNRESFIENEVAFNQPRFLDTHELEVEVDKVKREVTKMSSDLERVSLEYAELIGEMEVIKNNLDWLSKSTTFGSYTREMLQQLPQGIDMERLHDYRSQVNIRLYEMTKAERAVILARRGSSSNDESVDLEKLQQLISLYTSLSNQIDTLISVSSDYSIVLEEARSFLQERVVWTYSSSPIWKIFLV